MYADRTKNITSTAAAIISAYWWFSNSGIFLLLSELQKNLIGEHYPFITFTCCILSVQFLFERAFHLWNYSGWSDSGTEAITSAGNTEPSPLDNLFKQSQWFYDPLALAAGAGIVAIILGIPAINSPEFEQLDLAVLESGKRPTSSWVSSSIDRLKWDEHIVFENRYGNLYFVPLVSNQWKEGQPVAAFLRITGSELYLVN